MQKFRKLMIQFQENTRIKCQVNAYGKANVEEYQVNVKAYQVKVSFLQLIKASENQALFDGNLDFLSIRC